MKTYLKTVRRMFKKNISRFISIIFIVLIGVSLTSGVGSSTGKIKDSANDFSLERNVSDIIVKAKTEEGFSEAQITALKDEYGEENVNFGMSFDAYITVNGEKRLTRFYFSDDITARTVNKFVESDEEALAVSEGDIAVFAEKADDKIKGYTRGDKITVDYKDVFLQLADQNDMVIEDWQMSFINTLQPVTLTVTKIVEDPLVFAKGGEPSFLNGEDMKIPDTIVPTDLICVDDILYLPYSAMPLMQAKTDIYVSLANKRTDRVFSASYDKIVAEEKEKIIGMLAAADEKTNAEIEKNVVLLTLAENYSFKSLYSYADKISGLSIVLMAAFACITALVVLSNVTRLIDEERAQTACLISLGYSAAGIILKYVLFVLTATAVGGFAAYFVGVGLCSFIYLVFDYSFVMPPESAVFGVTFFIITLAIIVFAAVAATIRAGLKTAGETPADLLKPKSPASGRKVIIEKIPFIWNRLSFKYKSTARNVLRYRNRFIMTVVAVAGSMGLVMAGLALLDMCLFGDFGNASIAWLAVVIVVFAALLTLTAIYTITNISISERTREIATLMVLGYYDGEVSGYIYREIYIDAVVGIIFGYGVGAVLMSIIFAIMGFGSLGGVSWYVWLVSPVAVLFFTFLVTLILRKRIISIDMNASLKALE